MAFNYANWYEIFDSVMKTSIFAFGVEQNTQTNTLVFAHSGQYKSDLLEQTFFSIFQSENFQYFAQHFFK